MLGRKHWAPAAAVLCAILVAGCVPTKDDRLLAESGLRSFDPPYHASDDALRAGKVHFRNGDWGLAEQNFRKAVELSPKDAEAWLGLAASYDRLRRFDLADRAYDQAIKLSGLNTVILNNLGYSYLLRGNVLEARRRFLLAYEKAPNDPYVLNNLELLNESAKAVQRPKA